MANFGLAIDVRADGAIKAASDMQKVATSTSSAAIAVDKLGNAYLGTTKAVDKGSVALNYGSKSANQLAQSMEILTRRGNQGSISMTGFAGALGGISLIPITSKIIEMADSFQLLQTRVNIAAGGAVEGSRAFSELFAVSQNLGQSVNTTASVYTRLIRPIQEMGGTSADAIRTVETLGKVIALSGVSAREAQSTMLQFGQALASGKLAGDEFKSISENTPDVLNRLSQALGVTRGELKAMSSAGTLTSEVIVKAMGDMSSKVDEDFKKIPQTVDKGLAYLGNRVAEELNELNKSSGMTAGLSAGLKDLADNLDTVVVAIGGVAAIMAGRFANSLYESAKASQLFGAVTGRTVAATQAAALASKEAATQNFQETLSKQRLADQVLMLAVQKQELAIVTLNEAKASAAAAAGTAEEAVANANLVRAEIAVQQAKINTARATMTNAAAQEAATLAGNKLQVATAGVGAAMTAAGLATRAYGVASAALGGPIGILIGLLSVVAMNWDAVAAAAGNAEAMQRRAMKAREENEKAALGGSADALKKAQENQSNVERQLRIKEQYLVQNEKDLANKRAAGYKDTSLEGEIADVKRLTAEVNILKVEAQDSARSVKTVQENIGEFAKKAAQADKERRQQKLNEGVPFDPKKQSEEVVTQMRKQQREEAEYFKWKEFESIKGYKHIDEARKIAAKDAREDAKKQGIEDVEGLQKAEDFAIASVNRQYKEREDKRAKSSASHKAAIKEENALEQLSASLRKDFVKSEAELANFRAGKLQDEDSHLSKLNAQLETKKEFANLDPKIIAAKQAQAAATDENIKLLRTEREFQEALVQSLENRAALEEEIAVIRSGGVKSPFKSEALVTKEVLKEHPMLPAFEKAALINAKMQEETLKMTRSNVELGAALAENNRQRAFELSLIGKSAEEQERLKAAMEINRRYDVSGTGKTGKEYEDNERLREEELQSHQAYLDEKKAIDNDYFTQAQVSMQAYYDSIKTGAQMSAELGTAALQGFGDALIKAAETGKLSFDDLTKSVVSGLAKMIVQLYILKPLMEGIFGMMGGGAASSGISTGMGGSSTMFGDTYMPQLANGGGVSAKSYLVGERGPEIFTPAGAGHITPFEQIGGGGGVSVVINNNSGAPARVEESKNSQGQREISVIIGEAVAAETRKTGSSTNRAFQQQFGVQQTLIRR